MSERIYWAPAGEVLNGKESDLLKSLPRNSTLLRRTHKPRFGCYEYLVFNPDFPVTPTNRPMPRERLIAKPKTDSLPTSSRRSRAYQS